MSIMVDPRTGSGDLVPTLKALGTPAESVPLDFGDCVFFGKGPEGAVSVALELKRIDDILACIVSGRFSGHQLPGLVQNYDEIYLVIEGIYRPNPRDGVLETRMGKDWKPISRGHTQWMYRDLENFLATIEIRGGVRLRRTSNRQETARLIAQMYGWWQQDFEDHTSHRAVNRSRDTALLTAPSLKFQVAAALPGLGLVKAGMSAGHFGSVRDMINADEKAWIQLPGVGKKMAQTIVSAVSASE